MRRDSASAAAVIKHDGDYIQRWTRKEGRAWGGYFFLFDFSLFCYQKRFPSQITLSTFNKDP